MSNLIEGLIDGQSVWVCRETTILEAARTIGRRIPALCRHPGLPPDGNCRLCQVEINGRLVISCMYPLRESGFTVLTESPAVREARAFVLELLVNRCPTSPRLLALAFDYGVQPEERFQDSQPGVCILCRRCVTACESLGPAAISLVGRGRDRRVAGPFFDPPEDCLGCLACAAVCPTGHITFKDESGYRSIWGRDFPLENCQSCGRPFAASEQLLRSYYQDLLLSKAAGADDHAGTGRQCQDCRRRETASKLKGAMF